MKRLPFLLIVLGLGSVLASPIRAEPSPVAPWGTAMTIESFVRHVHDTYVDQFREFAEGYAGDKGNAVNGAGDAAAGSVAGSAAESGFGTISVMPNYPASLN